MLLIAGFVIYVHVGKCCFDDSHRSSFIFALCSRMSSTSVYFAGLLELLELLECI